MQQCKILHLSPILIFDKYTKEDGDKSVFYCIMSKLQFSIEIILNLRVSLCWFTKEFEQKTKTKNKNKKNKKLKKQNKYKIKQPPQKKKKKKKKKQTTKQFGTQQKTVLDTFRVI